MMPFNILHVICHDLGRELGCYGRKVIPSPRLDGLAEESVVFTSAFCAATPCSPSRGCLMTGRYAHDTGLIGLVNRGWNLDASVPAIVDCLREAGYHTAHFGLQHERKNPAENRYEHDWLDSRDAHEAARMAAQYLQTVRGPFYMNVGFHEVHLPFDCPRYTPAKPEDVEVPRYLPDTAPVRAELARFYGAVRYMDEAVGVLLDALGASGQSDDTIVLFTTDHGAAFPRAKSTLFDAGIGIAQIIRFPGGVRGECGALVSNIDVLPTLCEATGATPPEGIPGRSFYGVLTGQELEPRTEVFAEKNFHDHYDPCRAIRTERYKYIRSFTDQPKVPLPRDIKHSPMVETLRSDAHELRPREELYDLESDPDEEHNRIGDPALGNVRAELSARLDRWMEETRDPLLENIDLPYPPEQFPA
jgi:N-sulfoglucosamine sulfohydrolase